MPIHDSAKPLANGGLERRLDDRDGRRPEDTVKGRGELAVTVVDQVGDLDLLDIATFRACCFTHALSGWNVPGKTKTFRLPG
ncbi:MAG: hypothetical protein WD534_14250 [Phycisphaeraceae bacterium]